MKLKAGLARRLAKRARQSRRNNSASIFEQRAQAVERQAETIRQVLITEKNENPRS
jgi:hypothetical protein